jgi:D-alanyl-D-alanine carboxypeptidase (penicillin-binding protein 5/6)
MREFFQRAPFFVSLFSIFLLGFSLFFLPDQNSLIAQAHFQTGLVKETDFNLPQPARYPLKKTDLEETILTATAAAILDRQSGVFLYKKEADLALRPASTVKIMTALVSLENYSPFEVLMVPGVNDEGQDMELVEGELITVEALLYGLLVSSANDAARVLAQNYPGGELKFIERMNQKAKDLNLKNSFFTNPTGLDNGNGEMIEKPVSSAKDLAWLADYALGNELFAKIVATKQITLKDPQQRFVHPLFNLNELLWLVPEVKGVKTGWTEEARECLVTLVDQGDGQLIVVVLGSEDRFGETRKLIDWFKSGFEWMEITSLSTH